MRIVVLQIVEEFIDKNKQLPSLHISRGPINPSVTSATLSTDDTYMDDKQLGWLDLGPEVAGIWNAIHTKENFSTNNNFYRRMFVI